MKKSTTWSNFLQYISDKKPINAETVLELNDRVLEYILFEISYEQHSDSFISLFEEIGKIFQYKEYEQLTPEQIFLYGGIWGSLNMMSITEKKKKTHEKNIALEKKYRKGNYYSFINYVHDSPGIQNNELAKLCNVSKARISQISAEAYEDGLISVQTFGREKSYYLNKSGICVYKKVSEYRQQLKKPLNELLNNTFSNPKYDVHYHYNPSIELQWSIKFNELKKNNSLESNRLSNIRAKNNLYIEGKELSWEKINLNSDESPIFYKNQKEAYLINQA